MNPEILFVRLPPGSRALLRSVGKALGVAMSTLVRRYVLQGLLVDEDVARRIADLYALEMPPPEPEESEEEETPCPPE